MKKPAGVNRHEWFHHPRSQRGREGKPFIEPLRLKTAFKWFDEMGSMADLERLKPYLPRMRHLVGVKIPPHVLASTLLSDV